LVNHRLNKKFTNDRAKLIHDKISLNKSQNVWLRDRGLQKKNLFREKGVDRWDSRMVQRVREATPLIKASPMIDLESWDLVNLQDSKIITSEEFKNGSDCQFTNEELDEYIDRFSDLLLKDNSNKIYGISVPDKPFEEVKYNESDRSFYWLNEENKLNSHQSNLPSVIFPDGTLFYHTDGMLHRDSGAALEHLYSPSKNEYWLWGRQVTYEEFKKYNKVTRKIEFKTNDKYHRDDGPAVITFHNDGSNIEYYYENDNCIYSIKDISGYSASDESDSLSTENNVARAYKVTPRKPKVKKVTKRMPEVEFTELSKEEVEALRAIFRDHKDHLMKFKDEIHEAARKAIMKKNGGREPEYVEDNEPDEVPSIVEKIVEVKTRAAPDLTGSRGSQIKNGFVFGLKKGVINNSSQLLSQKLVNYTPLEGNEWMERFVQICILVGLAELFKRMPEGMANKLNMSEEMRQNLATELRYTSGENIGRDLVDIAASVLPLFTEVLKGVTTEELQELAVDFELSEEEADTAEELFTESQIDVGDLFSSLDEEVEEKITIKEEVQA